MQIIKKKLIHNLKVLEITPKIAIDLLEEFKNQNNEYLCYIPQYTYRRIYFSDLLTDRTIIQCLVFKQRDIKIINCRIETAHNSAATTSKVLYYNTKLIDQIIKTLKKME